MLACDVCSLLDIEGGELLDRHTIQDGSNQGERMLLCDPCATELKKAQADAGADIARYAVTTRKRVLDETVKLMRERANGEKREVETEAPNPDDNAKTGQQGLDNKRGKSSFDNKFSRGRQGDS